MYIDIIGPRLIAPTIFDAIKPLAVYLDVSTTVGA